MIVGIPNMQVHGDSRPSHNPASEGSLETDPTMAAYATESPPVLVTQMHHHSAFVGLPPQQVYVGQNGGHHHYPPNPDVGALASQFQALSMPPQQQGPPPPHHGAEAPQSGDSETGDDNDGTTETEEDPVKLFVGQVSVTQCFERFSSVIVSTERHFKCICHCLNFEFPIRITISDKRESGPQRHCRALCRP